MGRASSIEAALSKAPFQPVSLPPPANAPYSRWAGCHFFHTLPHKGQGCGPRARKQVSTTTEPSPFRSAGQRRLQTECSKPPGTNAPGISAPASSPPLSGTGWLQLGRASPIEATLSNVPFQPFPCHPLQMRHTAAGRDATSSASCPAKVRVAAHGPESRFPPKRSRSLFRAAGQRRLQTERSKPPGTNAPGISDPASSPPLSGAGWLQLGRASPIEATLSNAPFQPFPCHPLQIRHTAAGRDATSSASCPAKARVTAHGPESRFPPQRSRSLSGLRASVGFKPNAPSLPAQTRRASPPPQTARR